MSTFARADSCRSSGWAQTITILAFYIDAYSQTTLTVIDAL